MTVTFGTNSKNDLYLTSAKSIAVLNGLDAVLKACETASLAQLGEMVLATELGIPNFQTVWVGTPNYPLYTSYLRSTLESVDGVIEVESLDLKTVSNTLSYTATIRTIYGTGVING